VQPHKVILGIDPGLDKIGWGTVLQWDEKGKELEHGSHGYIETTKAKSLAERLLELRLAINHLLFNSNPDIVVVEEFYVNGPNKDGIHTIKAIGVILCQVASLGIPVYMYSPMTPKALVAIKRPKKNGAKGFEKVTKKDMQNGVNAILQTNFKYAIANCHPVDALAHAICYAKGKKPLDYGDIQDGNV